MSSKRQPKRERRNERRSQQFQSHEAVIPMIQDYAVQRNTAPFEPMNEAQGQYASLIQSRRVVFGTGAAGTGKSYVALALAVEALQRGVIQRIVVTRPLVEAGEEVGTLPGELDEKIAPYFAPARDILIERLGRGHFEGLLKAGRIQFTPLAFLRGTTFTKAWVILDEGQNTSVVQMKMLLTRLGRDSKLIINGDTNQCDLPKNVTSGLTDALKRFAKSKNIGKQHFLQADIVRDPFVVEVIQAYEGDDGSIVA